MKKAGVAAALMFVLTGCSPSVVDEPTAIANCKRDADGCVAATLAMDADKMYGFMHPATQKLAGGADGVKELIAKAVDDMRSGKEFHLVDVKVSAPTSTFGAGTHHFAYVEQHLVISPAIEPKTHIEQSANMLAVSDDGGRTWRFIDCAGLKNGNLAKLFPDFPVNHPLPAVKAPVIKRG